MPSTSASASEALNGSAVSRGSFKKRASSIKSNAGLYQLIEDMAGRLDEFGIKLDTVIELLRNKL